jgi:murein DD-endopeptidase MepM/ murein hydrolase activator NlpD
MDRNTGRAGRRFRGPRTADHSSRRGDDRGWNRKSFWYGPWGKSGVHKGIDIFARKGTNVVAPTYGVVIFRGTIDLGGRVLVLLGPKLRLHYFAHLDSWEVGPGRVVATGHVLGHVGDSGNAKGKPPHLH